MDQLIKKLNLKEAIHHKIGLFNTPDELLYIENYFKTEGVFKVETKIDQADKLEFVLTFGKSISDFGSIIPKIMEYLQEDAILWCCYPKKSSKKYNSDISRDEGWSVFSGYEFEPVRQVSINEDWSALRFRNVAFIKEMKRKKSFVKK